MCCNAVLQGAKDKKRKFVETVELQIRLKDYDPQKDKRFSRTVKLKIIPWPKLKVCVLGDASHCDEAKANNIPCMVAEALKKLNKKKKLVKKLGEWNEIRVQHSSFTEKNSDLSLHHVSYVQDGKFIQYCCSIILIIIMLSQIVRNVLSTVKGWIKTWLCTVYYSVNSFHLFARTILIQIYAVTILESFYFTCWRFTPQS